MELKTAKAQPIHQEGRFLVLIFGPDKDLKHIAQHARSRYAGFTVNVRSTDTPADAYAEHTQCNMRIIVDNWAGRQVARLYDQAKLEYKLMSWDGTALHDSSGVVEDEPVAPTAGFITLSDGRTVDRAYGLERAAKQMGMTVAALASLDDQTLSATVEIAIGKSDPSPVPAAAPKRGRPRKPKANETHSNTIAIEELA